MEIDGDSGGSEGGDGQSQVTQHKGRTQGRDQSDMAARAELTLRQHTWAQSDPEQRERVTRRRAAAHSDTKHSPSPVEEKRAPQRLTTTAHMATTATAAARTETPTRSHSPRPTGCPLPSDSDTDSEASDSQVTAFAARGRQRSQRKSQCVTAPPHKQHSSKLHQVISKLAQLSHHYDRQEQQTAASLQPRAQRDHSPFLSSPAMPPVCSVSMPAFATNPIDERQAAVAKAAVMDGDWDAANALSCPVLIANGTARWEPYDWKVLQKAKETVTTYRLKSEAARNIIQYVYTADFNCPTDCTSIASLLLTPWQLLIFE
ncbi:hypothetical protein HGM15179_020907 [Zosterops borbonicus]|uniref:Uncharacterized protein n=1 Tax=Zosterops borbonicus TaxID=364589 RepID=A0A8K1D6R7_9PASS|nr:hypothetical protein HGM15179_020907 [Zosterops borbonicus]